MKLRNAFKSIASTVALLTASALFGDATNFSSNSVSFTSGSGAGSITVNAIGASTGYIFVDGSIVTPSGFSVPYTLSYAFSAGSHTIYFAGNPQGATTTATGYVEYTAASSGGGGSSGGGTSGTVTTDQIYSLLQTLQTSDAASNAAIQTAISQIQNTLASNTATLSELSTDLTNLANALQAFETQTATNNSTLNAKIDTDISALNAKIDANEATLVSDISALNAKVDSGNAALQAQITANEAKRETDNAALNAKIDADNAALLALINANETKRESDIAALNTKIDAGNAALLALINADEAKREADVAALNNKIDADQSSTMNQLVNMASSLSTMQGELTALQTTLNTDNTALNTKIDANQAALVGDLDNLASEIAVLKAQIAANEAARKADQATTNTALTTLQSGETANGNAINTLQTSVNSDRTLEAAENQELLSRIETLQSQLNNYGKQVALQASYNSGSSSSTGTQLSTPSTLGSSSGSSSDSNPIADYDKRINDTQSLDQASPDNATQSGGSAKIPVTKALSLLDYLPEDRK